MNYGKIYYCDTANGIGCRTVLFVSGCRHHCKGCFNPETWNFSYGQPYTDVVQTRILESLQTPYIDGLTILGGEPFEPENQPVVHDLVRAVRTSHPDKSIWIYSGYTWEELIDPLSFVHTAHTMDILSGIDILVDGEYQEEHRNITLPFRGSSNQRILDVPESLLHPDCPVLSKTIQAIEQNHGIL